MTEETNADISALNEWLEEYTWIQEDGSIDHSKPRVRPEGLEISPDEYPEAGSEVKLALEDTENDMDTPEPEPLTCSYASFMDCPVESLTRCKFTACPGDGCTEAMVQEKATKNK